MMFSTDRFTHFSFAYHWEEEKVMVCPVVGTEVMVSAFHLQQYRTKAGFSCWLIMDSMSNQVIESYLQLYGETVKGLLFRVKLSNWVSSASSNFIAGWFEEWGRVYRSRGYSLGILCDVDWNQINSPTHRWLHYHQWLDVVILKVNKSGGPYCLLILYAIGFLVRLGIASNKIVAPFAFPNPATLDVYNLKGWLVNYQDVMKYCCWDYLPSYGMMF